MSVGSSVKRYTVLYLHKIFLFSFFLIRSNINRPKNTYLDFILEFPTYSHFLSSGGDPPDVKSHFAFTSTEATLNESS